ncbi:MAG: hypothetical protein JWN04_4437 [Myxococcaceae bacterium]|nr:hypothetical protein [Myxococcaceae bacterium]
MKLPPLVDLTCKQVTEVVSDYLSSSGMATRERARFEQHLHACTWCMDYLQQLEQATRAASQLREETSALPETALLALFKSAITPSERVREPSAFAPPAAEPEQTTARRPIRRLEGVRFAFKFLMPGAVGPVSSFAWPRPAAEKPGAWVEVGRSLEPCRTGIHACTTRNLSSWLHDTLWLVELGGDVQRSVRSVVAARGRLVREIEGWREGGAARFAQASYDHAVARAAAETPERGAAAAPCLASAAYHIPRGSTALAAFCSAMSVARSHGITRFEQAGYDAERRWQSRWIAQDLQLDKLLAEAAAR